MLLVIVSLIPWLSGTESRIEKLRPIALTSFGHVFDGDLGHGKVCKSLAHAIILPAL